VHGFQLKSPPQAVHSFCIYQEILVHDNPTDTPPAASEESQAPEMAPARKPRLALFGGTFDPVHNGHLFIAGEILRLNLADELLFIPARIPPHKLDQPLSDPQARMEMLQLALEPYPEFGISDIELNREAGPSYTIETMEVLAAAFPGHDLCFVMGMDSLAELHLWYQATELVGKHRLLVYPRTGVAAPPLATLTARFGPRNARKLLNSVLGTPTFPVSATRVRELAAAGQSLAGLVPASIDAYIREHKLYTEST
jgi:nicotinate-nucleotide adenylyltransferase